MPGGGAVKLTVADLPHAQRTRHPRPRRAPGRGGEDAAAGARGRRGASPVIDEEGGPRLVACIVERRGRFLVAQPFFDEGQQLALGRRSGQAVQAGELVVVEQAGGSARVVERLGSPDDVGHVLRALLLERGLAREWPEDALREARRASREREPDGRASRPARARGDHDRSARRRATSTTPSASSRTATACAPGCTSPTSPATSKPGGALDAEAARRTCSVYVPGRRSSRCCRSSSRPTPAACGPARCGASSASRCASAPTASPAPPHVRRALIRSRARLSYDEAHEVLEGTPPPPERRPARARRRARARPARAPACPRRVHAGAARALVRGRRRPRRWTRSWDEEPRAHALVEELMLLANEAVGGLLARAKRPALYRVHEHPKHEALLPLADRLTALGLPVVPLPERANGPEASRAVARQAELLEPLVRAAPGDARGRSARCSCARSSSRATTRSTPATPRWHRRPTCTSRRRSAAIPTSSCIAPRVRWRASARRRRRRATCRRSRCAARSASARQPMRSAAPMRSAWRSCCRTAAPRRLAPDVRGRRHGSHRRRAVRALRRGLRGLPARAAARRARALRQRRARRGARRAQLGAAHPPRRRALLRRHRRRSAARARDARRRARARGSAAAHAAGQGDDAAPAAEAAQAPHAR